MMGPRSMVTAVALLVLAQVSGGCGSSSGNTMPSAPPAALSMPQAAPSSVLPPAPIRLVVFTDPTSGFSTPDVYDSQEQTVQFNSAGELIWTADGTRFPEYLADGNFIGYHHAADRFFQVRFGTRRGRRGAYLTWTDDRLRGAPATILDLSVDGRGDLLIAETDVPVPGA